MNTVSASFIGGSPLNNHDALAGPTVTQTSSQSGQVKAEVMKDTSPFAAMVSGTIGKKFIARITNPLLNDEIEIIIQRQRKPPDIPPEWMYDQKQVKRKKINPPTLSGRHFLTAVCVDRFGAITDLPDPEFLEELAKKTKGIQLNRNESEEEEEYEDSASGTVVYIRADKGEKATAAAADQAEEGSEREAVSKEQEPDEITTVAAVEQQKPATKNDNTNSVIAIASEKIEAAPEIKAIPKTEINGTDAVVQNKAEAPAQPKKVESAPKAKTEAPKSGKPSIWKRIWRAHVTAAKTLFSPFRFLAQKIAALFAKLFAKKKAQ